MSLVMTKKRLMLAVATVAMLSSTALAQRDSNARKESIVKFFQAVGMRTTMTDFFKREVASYLEHWPDAVIADQESRGLFRSLTPDKAVRMKDLFRELGGGLTTELQSRIVTEVMTEETVEALAVPVYEKYFSESEMDELTAFCATPTGKALFDAYAQALSESMISYLRAKGFFNVLPSPDDEVAKLDRINADIT